MIEYFTAECCNCKNLVTGSWDWADWKICILGICKSCGSINLEEDCDWINLDKIKNEEK